jgi:hypothetical protein
MATQITIPGVPDGKSCLWQVDKIMQGDREVQFGKDYDCDTGKTLRAKATLKLPLKSTGSTCDQEAARKILPDGCVLEASGVFTQRADGFAHFTGDFKIKSVDKKELFRGTIEMMDRVGTHHTIFKCEKCNQKSHLEGWLVGSSSDSGKLTLRAMLALKGTAPSPASPKKTLTGILNGALMA